jgi:hypothetical protein
MTYIKKMPLAGRQIIRPQIDPDKISRGVAAMKKPYKQRLFEQLGLSPEARLSLSYARTRTRTYERIIG